MKIKIYLDKEDVKMCLEDLADDSEEVLANFYAHPEQIDYNLLIERKIKSICCEPRFYIDEDCFEIEKL